ncbi:MAG: SMC family ATPase [Bacteriovoracaceae bacterium]|nr:SMC family ATPase [Bacteriovoracaceae bacterium]
MKLNKLTIENMASLVGEHELDFNQIFQDSNLIAITGPTGSGKSTLLNCLSLALYGEHYKSNVTQIDMVSLGHESGRVSLEFEHYGKQYKALWEGKVRKKNGEALKLPKIKRELFEKQGSEYLFLEKNAEEILKLDFNQFSKTVILNQGEFAKFLTANFKDRKEILEKLYQSDLLSVLGKQLRDNITVRENKSENLKSVLDGLDYASVEEFAQINQKITFLDEQLPYHQAYLKKFEKTKNDFREILSYTQKIQQNNSILEKVKGEINELHSSLNKKRVELNLQQEAHQQANQELSSKKVWLTECIKNKLQLHSLKDKINHLNIDKEKITRQIQITKKDLADIEQSQREFAVKKEQLSAKYVLRLNDTNKIEIETLINKLQNLHQQLQNIKSQLSLCKNTLLEHCQKLGTVKGRLASLIQAHGLKELPEGYFEIQLKNITQRKQNIQLELEQTRHTLSIYNAAVTLLNDNQLKVSTLKQQSQESQTAFQQYEKEIELAHTGLQLIQSELKNYELTKAIQLCHAKALIDEVCPVCHSKDIPTTLGNQEQTDFNLLNEKLKAETDNLKIFTAKKQNMLIAIETSKKQMEYIENQQRRELEQRQLSDTTDLAELTRLQVTLNEKNKQLGQELTSLQQLDHQLIIQNESYQQTRKEIDELTLKVQQIEFDYEQMQVNKENIDTELMQSRNHLNLLLSGKTQEMNQITEIFNFYHEQKDILNKIVALDGNILFTKENLNRVHILIDAQLAELSQKAQQIEEAKQLQQDIEATLKAKLGTTDPERYLATLEENSKKQLAGLRTIENEYNQLNLGLKENESKFTTMMDQNASIEISLVQLFNYIAENKSQLQMGPEQLTFYSLQNRETLSKIYRNLGNVQNLNYDQKLFEMLDKAIKETYESLANEFSELKNKLTEYKIIQAECLKKKERFDQVNKEISSIKDELVRFYNISEIIGRDEFRNYVLSLIEEQLILQTNLELQHLCSGRYEIRHVTKKNQSPDFFVLDKLNGAMERKVSTLSGGETFMVSLAMALALSELTRGQTEIDSFFIDEGFGTLDRDSIEEVIEILTQIQTRGKYIGIISHVKHLTDRIPINLNLIKSSSGQSRIETHYNY